MLSSKRIPCAKGKFLVLSFFFYKSGEEADLENSIFIHSNSHTKSTGTTWKQGEQKQGKRKSATLHAAKGLSLKN